MKTLHLLRHAKSSWDDPHLDDQQRPLNQRGIDDCQLMAPALMGVGCCFEHAYCSTAIRAKRTLQLISEHHFEPGMERLISASQLASVSIDSSLYTFDWGEALDYCQALPETIDQALLVGHNPAFTELHDYLSTEHIEHLPTCAYVRLECAVNDWQELTRNCARTRYFITPKMLKQGLEISPYPLS
ncbi:SixA phosphatase family protein [Thalassotalea mangrovi]|uniref:Phosphoglycerate mutase n=1 Tax=Thalassotalea mangrovi TaxID=2572245 RepID=A0A4U1B4E8_9GAMM|nr:histidine phosphatase family protein [Thalassotalea mangrovi]TKB45079.1 phosphoglycerate mutase [Thalassotalea mangrovi]